MNDLDFFKSFHFNEFSYTKKTHIDNSQGIAHHYIGYMKTGSGILISAGEQLTLFPGDLFYIPKACRYHSYWIPADPEVRFDSIGFDYFPVPEGTRFLLQKLPCSEKLLEAFAPLSADKTVSTASIGTLYTFLGILQPQMLASPPERKNALTDAALRILNQEPNTGIAQIAASCGVSEATLYNHFRRTLGKTPNAVRQELLCQKAVQLLITTSLSVEEVSRECGFSSASYFRKVLFHIKGKTPRQLRAEANVL